MNPSDRTDGLFSIPQGVIFWAYGISKQRAGEVMENTPVLDWIAGGLAIAIAIGGLVMLFQGLSGFNEQDKKWTIASQLGKLFRFAL